MADRVTKKQVDAALQRSTVLDLLHTCGMEPSGIMSNEEDLLAVKRYVQWLQRAVFEMSRPKLLDEPKCSRCGQYQRNHERHCSPGCPGVYSETAR